jgi:hypothetical protein
MLIGGMVAIVAAIPLSPPGAQWFDALFGYGSVLLLLALIARQEVNAVNPPPQRLKE